MDIYKSKRVQPESGEDLITGSPHGNATSGNGSYSVVIECSSIIPSTQELFRNRPTTTGITLAVGAVCTIFVLAIFAEECHFLVKHFRRKRRRLLKTVWVLAVYPVYSIAGLLGCIVPRAGTLVDLVANVYLASCMYEFVRLMVDYMGGDKRMWAALEDTMIGLRSPPCCCCLCCLPSVKFTRSLYLKLQVLVLQVALVRPILFFMAAVLWANGTYTPGVISLDNAYIYISVLNLFSTFWAVYGLVLTQKAFEPALGKFHLKGKFMSFQVVLLISILLNLIINITVAAGGMPCNALLSSEARGDRIYHALMVVLMAPLCLMGRTFYRRAEEATLLGEGIRQVQRPKEMTDMEAGNTLMEKPEIA